MKKVIRYAGNIISILSIVFVGVAIWRADRNAFKSVTNASIYGWVLIGSVWGAIWVYLMGYAWKRVIDYLSGNNCNTMKATGLYAKSNLGKYIPGNVMHYIERNMFALDAGLVQSDVTLSTILEVLGMVIATIVLGFILSVEDLFRSLSQVITARYIWMLIVGIILAFGILIVFVVRSSAVRNQMAKLFSLSFGKVYLGNLLIYILSFLVHGVFFAFMVGCVADERLVFTDFGMLISAYVIAYFVGFVVPGAPGGMGVRELILTLLLHNNRFESVVLVAAVAHRLTTVFGDVIAYLMAKVLIKKE